MNKERKSIDYHNIEHSNSKAEYSITSHSIAEFDLTIKHFHLLKDRKVIKRRLVLLPLLSPLIVLFGNFQAWSSLNDFFEFLEIFLGRILVIGFVLYFVLLVLFKVRPFHSWRWRVILGLHKRFDSNWYDPNKNSFYVGFVMALVIATLINASPGAPPKVPDLTNPLLWFSIIVLSLTAAMQQILGDRYPYAYAFYEVRKWYKEKSEGNKPDVNLLVEAFRDLERHFMFDGLSFEEVDTDFIEGIIFLDRFGSAEDDKQFSGEVATLLKAMQPLDNFKTNNYRSILSAMEKMDKLATQDIRKFIRRKITWIERLKQEIMKPEVFLTLLAGLATIIIDFIRS